MSKVFVIELEMKYVCMDMVVYIDTMFPPPFCLPELWAIPLARSSPNKIELVLAFSPPCCHATHQTKRTKKQTN